MSDSDLFSGSATLIAEDIRRAIFEETQLTASAGVAPCKFVAKIASDENKPNGICVVTPETQDSFVKNLPLGKIPGVGKVTLQKLNKMGLYTCQDVREYPIDAFVKSFGKFGPVIWDRSHGIDERELTVSRKRKSVGVERTLAQDITTDEDCLAMLDSLYPKLLSRLEKASPKLAIQSQGVKLKFNDFQQTTVEHRHQVLDKNYFKTLLAQALERRGNRGVRLVGLSVGLPDSSDVQQMVFDFENLH